MQLLVWRLPIARRTLRPVPSGFVTVASTRSASGSFWCLAVEVWSLVFAAPHFYWASGGRAELGAQAAAADAALQQTWFAAYNLVAGCLGVLGAVMALALATNRFGCALRRWLVLAAAAACAILVVRGLLGVTLLGVAQLHGTLDPHTPTVLLAIEPWFVLGGLVYGGMALTPRQRPSAAPYLADAAVRRRGLRAVVRPNPPLP